MNSYVYSVWNVTIIIIVVVVHLKLTGKRY